MQVDRARRAYSSRHAARVSPAGRMSRSLTHWRTGRFTTWERCRSPSMRQSARGLGERRADRWLPDLGNAPLPALKHRELLPPRGGTPTVSAWGRQSSAGIEFPVLWAGPTGWLGQSRMGWAFAFASPGLSALFPKSCLHADRRVGAASARRWSALPPVPAAARPERIAAWKWLPHLPGDTTNGGEACPPWRANAPFSGWGSLPCWRAAGEGCFREALWRLAEAARAGLADRPGAI